MGLDVPINSPENVMMLFAVAFVLDDEMLISLFGSTPEKCAQAEIFKYKFCLSGMLFAVCCNHCNKSDG